MAEGFPLGVSSILLSAHALNRRQRVIVDSCPSKDESVSVLELCSAIVSALLLSNTPQFLTVLYELPKPEA